MRLSASPRILEFSNNCHSPTDGRFCEAGTSQRYSRGILGKGKESYGFRPALCGKSVGPGANYCTVHEKIFTKMQIENARRRRKAAEAKGLTAACHSRTCAPPPVGSGGSAQTSQQQHAALIQKIRTDLEAGNAANRAKRAAAKKGTCHGASCFCKDCDNANIAKQNQVWSKAKEFSVPYTWSMSYEFASQR